MLLQEEVLVSIGKLLERLRLRGGYTSYEDFAISNELSRMQYWRLEKGKNNLTMGSLIPLLNIHGVSLSEFFSDDFDSKFPAPILPKKKSGK